MLFSLLSLRTTSQGKADYCILTSRVAFNKTVGRSKYLRWWNICFYSKACLILFKCIENIFTIYKKQYKNCFSSNYALLQFGKGKDNYWWWRASCSKNKYSWSRAFCILSFANPLKYNSVLKVLEIQDNLFEQTLWLTYSQRKLMHEYPIKPTSTYFLMEK